MTKYPYLQSRYERKYTSDLKKHVVFGLLVGWLCLLAGGYLYLFVPGVNDGLWWGVAIAGMVLLALTILVPGVMAPAAQAQRAVGGFLFQGVFYIVLAALYLFLLWPLGAWTRRRSPLTQTWEDAVPDAHWEKKEIRSLVIHRGERGRSLATAPARLIGFFVSRGHAALVPAIVVMILIGFTLIFVKISVLAPFVYTLF